MAEESKQNRHFSKVDRWYSFSMGISLLMIVGTIVLIVMIPGAPLSIRLAIIAFCGAVVLLIYSITYGTHYTFEDTQLMIRSGPLRYTVKYEDISSVVPTTSVLSAPALSFDRLEITYGDRGKKICVSPKDKETFLDELKKRATKLATN